MTEKSDWPNSFPDGVPPENASPAEGDAFRLVKNFPPSNLDFLSTIEEFPCRKFSDDKIWMAYGISFYRQLECCQKTKNRHPGFKNRRIAQGTLKKEHGVELSTNSKGDSHFTVWKRNESIIHPDFITDGEAP